MEVSAQITDLEAGKAAEYLVVADLILSGRRAYLTDQGLPYDVILDDDGILFRIQVKASRDPRPVPQRAAFTPGYIFHVKRAGKAGRRRYQGNEFDLLALVALDRRIIAYLPFADASAQCLILRPPGYRPAGNATRLENIDQLPVENALAKLRGFRKGGSPACNVPASIVEPSLKRGLLVAIDSSVVTRPFLPTPQKH
jgi:hypothetical protein